MLNLKEIQEKFNSLPSGDVQIILAEIIGRNRAYILAHPEFRPNIFQRVKIWTALKKLLSGCPVAAILGHKEFYGLDFLINTHTLIPRPDTEIMVEEAVNYLDKSELNGDGPALIDIGTGSGCIPISIIKALNRKAINAFAVDISRSALRMAKKNVKRHKVNITLFRSDLFSKFGTMLSGCASFVITANLPYLTGEQYRTEPSIRFEPETALVSDETNGLNIYAKLFGQIDEMLKNKPFTILCEIDPRQNVTATAMAKQYFPDAAIKIKKDLSGRDRLLIIKQTPNWKP